MKGVVTSLHRHPVKGFTPERRGWAQLPTGGFFPADRLYAVENGPSGFDPAAPAFTSKMKFAVLASIPKVARAHTAYDEADGRWTVQAGGEQTFSASLWEKAGRDAFAVWLARFLGEEARGALKVVHADGHRFTDHPRGCVSVVNLASVRDLSARLGREIAPVRFRANLYVDGWDAWSELAHAEGAALRLGRARARVFKPILRCAATHVDPVTGERDIDLVAALRQHYGHAFCGLYLDVAEGGIVGEGDAAELG